MTSRHSRRLQGLGPEHLAYEDRCFAKARENSHQCGHCRRVNMPDSEDTLSTEDDDDDDDDPIWRMPAELRGPTRHRQSFDAMKKNPLKFKPVHHRVT